MKIVIDSRMYNESGIGRYIRNLTRELEKLDRQNEYFLLLQRPEYDSLVYHTNFQKILANFRWYSFKEQYQIIKILSQIKVDLVHFPHFNVPIFYQGKFVVTIHDLIHQHYSMQRATTHSSILYKIKRFGYRKVFQYAINKSSKILVPSNFVKNLLVSEWKVDDKKIAVSYEGIDAKLTTIIDTLTNQKEEKILKKMGIKSKYIFYVGNAHPHKNVEGLIKAYLLLRKKYSDLSLVLSGYDHYFWQRIKKDYKYEGIIYTGYIYDEELVALYKNASSFVMPSFEEGFGIPLLEAMACSTPVVSSNVGALSEVGGNACLYFDPHNSEDMIDKISQVLNNEKLRKDLIEKGKMRVKQFSWEKLAKETLRIYESV